MADTLYSSRANFYTGEKGKELIPLGLVSTGVLATSIAIFMRPYNQNDLVLVTLA